MQVATKKMLLAILVLSWFVPLVHGKDNWLADADKAVAKARQEKKDLLLLYTGSDWCRPCQKLEEEVFSGEGFYDEVAQNFVLVKFDFPKEREQSERIKKQNARWSERFGVSSYPTVILLDDQLLPYGIAGYEPGGVENYLGKLAELQEAKNQRDENLAAAEKATGAERAKLLDRAMSGMDEQIVEVYYEKIVAEIVKLDSDDELGLRSKWNAAKDSELRKVIMADILMISRLEKPARAIEFIDQVVQEIEFPPREMLGIMQVKLNLVRQLNDNEALDRLLDEMISLEGVEGETRERLLVRKILLMVGTKRRPEAMKLLDEAIAGGGSNLHLYIAKGELLAAENDFKGALKAYDRAMGVARGAPDILIELVSAKADALFELKEVAQALQTLDNFADDTQLPSDLRAEALLHKAMIMRDSGRRRQARLAENRAVEIAESAKEKAEIQKLVERLRKKYGD